MKRMSIVRSLAILVVAILFIAACTKENTDVRLDQKIASTQLLNVTSDSATVVGFVVAAGNGFTEKGVCYNTATAPTIANSKVAYTGKESTATFKVTLTGLAYATKYFARAYATGSTGTIYGEEYSFTTLPIVPVLTTAAITAITGNSATGGGNVTVAGGADVTARGIVYDTIPAPTIAGSKTTDDKGTGAFVSTLTSLKGNVTYHIRAYATNSAGTGYGPVVTFKTLVDLPVVTTAVLTGITKVAAISGGAVTYNGGAAVTERGIVWGTSVDPTVAGTKIAGGAGIGAFVSNLINLTGNTTYHVRSYAVNSAGTAYGADLTFTTLSDITKLWVVGDYNSWDNSDKASFIISTATSNGDAEGYVYLKAGGFKLTTDHSWTDPATFGDAGAGKLTNPGGNIPVAADGYYLIKANTGTKTYSVTLTTWGIIGDATSGKWDTQTNMVYDPVTQTFSLVAHLTAGGLKFRGTTDYAINFGGTALNAPLVFNGSNIPVTAEGDYIITLDLSHPNAYTYSATSWGIIGDASPGGWDTDTPMSWDAAKNVWKATVALVSGSGSKTFKFRADHAWVLNYGGNGTTDGSADNYTNATTAPLSAGGKNLGVPGNADGTYTVILDIKNLKATVTKN